MTAGSDIAAEVSAAIAEAGAATGDGPLFATISRPGIADETTYPVTPAAATTHTCTVVLTEYSDRDRNGTNIRVGDIKALIAPDAESDPRNGDSLIVGGKTYKMVNVMAVKPGGIVLLWEVQCREEGQ
jgi:hypothetical protein